MSMMWHPVRRRDECGFQFHLDSNFSNQSADLRIGKLSCGVFHTGKLEFVAGEPGEISEPTLQVPHHGDELQHLFNALWEFGFRPPERARKDDILSAKDDHLDDMRKILFNQMGIDK
jgi:hypothetical protein